jgi:drug/metabolite transporter (DMT)-like permease
LTPVPATARERRLAYLAWITICIVWGTTYLGIRVALESLPVALFAGLRWTVAGVILLVALRVMGQTLPAPRTWGSIAIAGFLLIVLGNGGVVWAEQYVASGVMFMVIGTATGEWSRLTFTTRSFSAWIYLVTVGSVVAYSAYVYALKYLPVSTVSLYSYVNPLIAVVLGSLLLSESFSSRTLVASALVLAGVALVRSAAGRSAAATTNREVAA